MNPFAAHFEPEPWQREAACRDSDPALFFSERGDNAAIAAAKAICSTCPVIAPCLELGMSEHFGVFGGRSERERRNMRVAWNRARRRAERRAG